LEFDTYHPNREVFGPGICTLRVIYDHPPNKFFTETLAGLGSQLVSEVVAPLSRKYGI
jgi:hypothetical protein